MTARVALAALPLLLLLLAACVAEEAAPAPPRPTPATPSGTAAGAPPPAATATASGPLSDAAVVALLGRAVCWHADPALAGSCLPPGPDALAAIAAMGASGDARFIAPLIDMRALDIGWERNVEDALEALTGARLDEPYAWYQFGYRAPVTPGYPDWKAALLSVTASAGTNPRFEELLLRFEPEDPVQGDSLTGSLVWTGVQPNGIPPLTAPATVHRLEERFLAPTDVVYGLQIEGEARAYPRRVVAWHGVVNDSLGDTPVLLSHCLPCGGAAAFDRSHEGETLDFGTAGLAFLGRTLLFDTQQARLWDPVAGAVLDQVELVTEERLRRLPLVTTTWGAWSELHPNTTVLALETGHVRDYAVGAAIAGELAAARPLYLAIDPGELPQRQPVIGIALTAARRAYPVEDIEARGIVHDNLGEAPIVLLSRGPGLGTRAYEAGDLAFDRLEVAGDDLIAVDVGGERWFVNERALVSALDGREHARLPLWQGYWSAWAGAGPSSEVWGGGS